MPADPNRPPRRRGGKSDQRRAAKLTQQREALEHRISGLGYREIADTMGISLTTAYRLVQGGMQEIIREPAEQMLTIETDRLDKLLAAQLPSALQGDPRAAETALKIMARIDRLYGLDQPTQTSHQAAAITLLETIAAAAHTQATGDTTT